jgi:hypothetical protein
MDVTQVSAESGPLLQAQVKVASSSSKAQAAVANIILSSIAQSAPRVAEQSGHRLNIRA